MGTSLVGISNDDREALVDIELLSLDDGKVAIRIQHYKDMEGCVAYISQGDSTERLDKEQVELLYQGLGLILMRLK